MADYYYQFDNGSQITISTSDTAASISGLNPAVTGYAITNISGSYNGEVITALNGIGGGVNTSFGGNNTVFPVDGTGDGGTSVDGIDQDGITFDTVSNTYNIYSIGGGQYEVDRYALDDSSHYIDTTYISIINYSQACFCEGTHIDIGDCHLAVELLKVGMLIPTTFGGHRPIVWIGHRIVNCKRHPNPQAIWPIKISANAFGDGLPIIDLFLSPDHSIFVKGVLVPVRYLVNGRTISQEPRETVKYWHVELDAHDVILAEGIQCESYLDTGNRSAFANNGPPMQMHPDFALSVWAAAGVAPMVTLGSELSLIRDVILRRAEAMGTCRTTDPNLRIAVDGVEFSPEIVGGNIQFSIPYNTAELRLVSRAEIPAHIRHDATDHRRLGVAISEICIEGHKISKDTIEALDGFYGEETLLDNTRYHWTDGNALLPNAGGCLLKMQLVLTALYWDEDKDNIHNFGVSERNEELPVSTPHLASA